MWIDGCCDDHIVFFFHNHNVNQFLIYQNDKHSAAYGEEKVANYERGYTPHQQALTYVATKQQLLALRDTARDLKRQLADLKRVQVPFLPEVWLKLTLSTFHHLAKPQTNEGPVVHRCRVFVQQRTNVEDMRELVNEKARDLTVLLASATGVDRHPLRMRRLNADRARSKYSIEATETEKQLSDVEAAVEELRNEVVERRWIFYSCWGWAWPDDVFGEGWSVLGQWKLRLTSLPTTCVCRGVADVPATR